VIAEFGGGPLIKEEKKAISEFIKASKERNRKQKGPLTKKSKCLIQIC
jgi:hypothetical protein